MMTFVTINLFLLFTSVILSSADQCPMFNSKANFTIEKYVGFWYEVARIPNNFELDTRCNNVTYTLNSNGTMVVLIQGTTTGERNASFRGLATRIESTVPASFRVAFESGQEGALSVLETDYKQYAAVYSCSVAPITGAKIELGFILSREKKLQPMKLWKAIKAFADADVDFNKLVITAQNC